MNQTVVGVSQRCAGGGAIPVLYYGVAVVETAMAEDPEEQPLEDLTLRGWPNEKSAVPKDIQPCWTFREKITH